MAQEEGFMMIQKGKENVKTRDKVSDSCSPTSKHAPRIMNLGITMIKRKKNKVGNGEGLDESLIRMVIDDAEKCGGRRRPKVAMDNFRIIMDDLALVDVKPDKGKLREEMRDPRLSFGLRLFGPRRMRLRI
ncbi:hypothetical protein Goari_004818 [Gossypium aridum]|uniref:Uncharacterized protein n=1 Tax=Gossypium aridum TaxID=34290 RepID=A0A7J8Y4N1_GOSAI|nr:hypothetical protein [Gossypium aridum]